ncbi:MAG TPA: hypothetical protein VMW55_03390 [Nitrosopumilaceae archaeon]|nr:hypothetical protein [Nitrosopumilaceae archaeon]
MESDLLDITKSQAQILRAIAYFENRTKITGFTRYNCNSDQINKKIRIARTTFNDNIQKLVKIQMVLPLKEIKKGKRPASKPYSITHIGQIAWLRHFPDSENIEIISELFPNIQLSAIDLIINKIELLGGNSFKDKFALKILKIALDSINLSNKITISLPDTRLRIQEKIKLHGYGGRMETTYQRSFIIPNRKYVKLLQKKVSAFKFNDKEISLVDRVTFLFYYNLIQMITDRELFIHNIQRNTPGFIDIEELTDLLKFSKLLIRKRKFILDKITSNDMVNKIMCENIEQLKEYKDIDFKTISNIFQK